MIAHIDTADSASGLAADAAERISSLSKIPQHDIALTLGSGWAKAADLLGETGAELDAGHISGFSP